MKKLATLLLALGVLVSANMGAMHEKSSRQEKEMPLPLKQFIIQEMKKDPQNLLPPHQKERIISTIASLYYTQSIRDVVQQVVDKMIEVVPEEIKFNFSYSETPGHCISIYETNDPRYPINFGYRRIVLKDPRSNLGKKFYLISFDGRPLQ